MTTAESAFTSGSKDMDVEERQFHPMSATILMDQDLEEQVPWVFEDYLPVGSLVILAAKPKVGKTTLAYQLAVKVAKGESFLERSTMQGAVLILALEEHPRDVRLRLKELGGTLNNLYVHTGGLEPNGANMEAIEAFVKEHAVKLILVDTLAMFWQLDDESDPSRLTKAIKPLLRLARRTGACILLIHHFRKSEGEQGDEIRGSGALLASVDVALRVYRDGNNSKRILKAVGRYPDTPAELVIELKDGEYLVIDAERQTAIAEQQRLIASLTSTAESIDVIAKRAGVPLAKAYRHMKRIIGVGKANGAGRGVKGDPFLYWAVLGDSLSSDAPSLERKEKDDLDLPVTP
jgi:hypothetical protein